MIKGRLDWAGEFMTMSNKMAHCTSEENMYQILKRFKDNFNTEYGKLSRTKRLKDGFRNER